MSEHPQILNSERSIFERSLTIRVIWVLLIAGCVGFAAAGFWLRAQPDSHHEAHFAGKEGIAGAIGTLADGFPAFYALVGFASFAFIVLAGQHLRAILMRPEGYYDGAEAELPRTPTATDEVAVDDIDTAPESGAASDGAGAKDAGGQS